eukprot:m.95894 g.95894  ORF g.95894 m.95894 type:complete len:514 (-) comp26852_c0_seq2:84-1625(-)
MDTSVVALIQDQYRFFENFQIQLLMEEFPHALPFALGVALIISAPKLSKNIPAYYFITGILLSVFVVFFAGFLQGRKTGIFQFAATAIIGGVWHDELMYYIGWTVLAVALISFSFVYWYGPPQEARTYDLLEGFVTICGAMLTWQRSFFPSTLNINEWLVLAITLIVVNKAIGVLEIFWFALSIVMYPVKKISNGFGLSLFKPAPRKLLSLREYHEEGVIYTKEQTGSLQTSLRDQSLGTVIDKYMSKLKDPKSFATFLLTGEHVTKTEKDAYSNGVIEPPSEDDWGSDEENLEYRDGQLMFVPRVQKPKPKEAIPERNRTPYAQHEWITNPGLSRTQVENNERLEYERQQELIRQQDRDRRLERARKQKEQGQRQKEQRDKDNVERVRLEQRARRERERREQERQQREREQADAEAKRQQQQLLKLQQEQIELQRQQLHQQREQAAAAALKQRRPAKTTASGGAMWTASELDALDNEQIVQVLRKNDLKVAPCTASSRKLLIKRIIKNNGTH